MKKSGCIAVAAALALASQGAAGQLSLTPGAEYAIGSFATMDRTGQWVNPLVAKYEAGPWTLKVNTRSFGADAAVFRGFGEAAWAARQAHSGFSDVVAGGFYNVLAPSTGVGVDVGLKVKSQITGKEQEPLTTGRHDYSIQANLYRGFGGLTTFGSVGWSRNGTIRAREDGDGFAISSARQAWYASLGVSYKLTGATQVGLAYDWRQNLYRSTREIGEATLFVTHSLTSSWKLQGYAVGGFSDVSPNWGAGASVGYTW